MADGNVRGALVVSTVGPGKRYSLRHGLGKVMTWKVSHAPGVPLDNPIFSSPIVAGDSIYIASLGGTVFGYMMTQDRVLSTPWIEDGILYFGDNDAPIYVFGAGPALVSGRLMSR